MVTLQHLIFPKTEICTDEPMYFRRNGQAYYAWTDDSIFFLKDGSAEFDTYFNGLSAEKIFKYTTVKKIMLKLRLQGIFRITLMRKEKYGSEILTEFISEEVISTDWQIKDIILDFDCGNTFGMYCFKILGVEDNSRFFGGEYCCDLSEESIRKVKLGIDICTFKREKYIQRNIKSLETAFLTNKESPLYGNLEIFISDNSQTLPEEMNTEFVHIFKNKNVGGAGGFTRNLIEIIRDGNPKGITHALIMDDDVVIEPEAIFKTFMVLSVLKEEYHNAFIGGAMLRLDRQNIQVESGAVWNNGAVMSLKSGLDLRSLDACLYNELEETADYNAWWYSVVPIENVRPDNLPLPIFIRGDDAEYGLRNTKQLILMNGICVWHEPFDKKYSSNLYYYIFRNRLIDNAIRGVDWPKKKLLEELKDHVYNELFCLRYKNVDLLLRGIEDYFRGIDWLKAQDGEKLHKQILADSYKLKYVEELDFVFSYPQYERMLHIPEDRGIKGLLKKLAIELTFHGVFLKADRDKIVPTIGVSPRQLIKVKRSLNYDLSSKKGFVTEKNVKEALQLYRRYRRVCRLINRQYDKMNKIYNLRGGELTNLDFWNKYLGIDASVEAPAVAPTVKNPVVETPIAEAAATEAPVAETPAAKTPAAQSMNNKIKILQAKKRNGKYRH